VTAATAATMILEEATTSPAGPAAICRRRITGTATDRAATPRPFSRGTRTSTCLRPATGPRTLPITAVQFSGRRCGSLGQPPMYVSEREEGALWKEAGHRRGWRGAQRRYGSRALGSRSSAHAPKAGHRGGRRGETSRTSPTAGEVAHVHPHPGEVAHVPPHPGKVAHVPPQPPCGRRGRTCAPPAADELGTARALHANSSHVQVLADLMGGDAPCCGRDDASGACGKCLLIQNEVRERASERASDQARPPLSSPVSARRRRCTLTGRRSS
jgi:hypothetical protein